MHLGRTTVARNLAWYSGSSAEGSVETGSAAIAKMLAILDYLAEIAAVGGVVVTDAEQIGDEIVAVAFVSYLWHCTWKSLA